MIRSGIIILLTFFCSFHLPAQELDHVQGELLIKLKENNSPQDLVAVSGSERVPYRIEYADPVSAVMNIHKYRFDFNAHNENVVLESIRNRPEVEVAQFNHIIKLRATVPDDPLFSNQWQYINTGQVNGGVVDADLDIELAWDNATGGLTLNGDTIVVCIIDDGLHPSHLDFEDNRWVNHAEIPDNDTDDDNNGYVDDYWGWNTEQENDDTDEDNWHGTPVAGIVGAKGNNGLGVSGVNWTVKLMIVFGGTGVESEVLAAYSYPLTFRKKYNETNGQEGAFVVATNASWGVDLSFPDDAPLWCAMYDSLGHYGILNCGATSNSFVNVDTDGDLPTSCPSDFLIAVTNIGPEDQFENAGYGSISIDLGAYGAHTYTADIPNGYGEFGGTSGACPHVTGTVGLLYSSDCDALNILVQSDPSQAALMVKEAILGGVTPNASLEGRTLTGGRLNVNGAMDYLLFNCGPCPNVSSITIDNIHSDGAVVEWIENDSIIKVDMRYKIDGSPWDTVENVSSPYNFFLTGPCAGIEFQLAGFCSSDTAGYSRSYFFRTDGCCDIPLNFQAGVIDQTTAQFTWDDVTAADSYVISLRVNGQTSTETYTVSGNEIVLSDLLQCTEYLVNISSACADSSSAQSDAVLIKTFGCGVCLDADYCTASGTDTDFEWIGKFSIDSFINESGDDDGYGDYTGLIIPDIELEKTYDASILPGESAGLQDEAYRMWIDYNQDGNFSDDEIIIDTVTTGDVGAQMEFTVPEDALLGSTRLRIAIQFLDPPPSCNTNFFFGEYEDYCITIDENSSTINRLIPPTEILVYPNPANDYISLSIVKEDTSIQSIELLDYSGRTCLKQTQNRNNGNWKIDVSRLSPGIYLLKGRTKNDGIFTKKVVIL